MKHTEHHQRNMHSCRWRSDDKKEQTVWLFLFEAYPYFANFFTQTRFNFNLMGFRLHFVHFFFLQWMFLQSNNLFTSWASHADKGQPNAFGISLLDEPLCILWNLKRHLVNQTNVFDGHELVCHRFDTTNIHAYIRRHMRTYLCRIVDIIPQNMNAYCIRIRKVFELFCNDIQHAHTFRFFFDSF